MSLAKMDFWAAKILVTVAAIIVLIVAIVFVVRERKKTVDLFLDLDRQRMIEVDDFYRSRK